MSNPVDNLIDAFNQLAQYRPETAGDWERFLQSQPEIWQAAAMAYSTLADNSRSGMDFDVNTAAGLDDMSTAVAAVSELSQSAHEAFGHGS